MGAARGGLHQHIAAQRLVIVQIPVAAAQAMRALRNRLRQAVFDTCRVMRIGQRSVRCMGQSNVSVNLAQQRKTTDAARRAAAEVSFNHPAFEASKVGLVVRTLWNRKSSDVAGARCP